MKYLQKRLTSEKKSLLPPLDAEFLQNDFDERREAVCRARRSGHDRVCRVVRIVVDSVDAV